MKAPPPLPKRDSRGARMKDSHILHSGSNSPEKFTENNTAAQELVEELLIKNQRLEEQTREAELKLRLLEAEHANQMNTGSIPVLTVKQPGSKKIDLIEIGSDLEDNVTTVPKENSETSQKLALEEE